MNDFFSFDLNFWNILIPTAISSMFVLLVNFLNDRGYRVFHQKEQQEEIRKNSPQIELLVLRAASLKWKDPTLELAYQFRIEITEEGARANFEELSQSKKFDCQKIKMIRLINNTNFGCVIESITTENGIPTQLEQFPLLYLDAESSLTLYMDPMHCPQSISLLYKGHRLLYPGLNISPFDYRIPAAIQEIKYKRKK